MEKNKLGIVINTTKSNNRTSGFRAIYRFNDDEWSSVVRDTGAELKKVTNNSASAPIHFIQFESNGCCYCIMQSIAGRNDYQSAWIFIHKDIILPKGELSSIIQKVEEVLSLDVEDKKAELDILFEKSYPITNNPGYSVSSGATYAVRYYGNGTNLMYTRSSVLDDYLYQSEYSMYKSVFLIDRESGLQVSDAQDLSNTKLEKSFVIELPTELYGFKHNLGADSLRVTEGSLVQVTWTRSGYAPIPKKGKCSEELLIQKTDCHRSFRLNLFRVVDKVTRNPLNARPTFCGKHWVNDKKNPTVVFFREDDLNCVSCRVDLQTYEPFNGTLDLTQPNEKGEFVIELQPEHHEYKCCIETNIPDARTIKFVINTQYKLKGSEIPGFQFDGTPSETRVNILKGARKQAAMSPVGRDAMPAKRNTYTGQGSNECVAKGHHKKSKPWLIPIGIVMVLAVLGGFYFLFFGEEKVSASTNVEAVEPTQETDWDKALGYLTEHATDAYWIKADMEKYTELKGVYSMIKDYKFKDLKSFIEKHLDDLNQLESWKRLYDKINTCNDKKGSFKAKDGKIDIEEYLKKDFESMEDIPVEGDASETSGNLPRTPQTRHDNNTSSGTGSPVPSNGGNNGNCNSGSNSNSNSQDSNV